MVTLSFSLIQVFYVVTDIIQGFFLKKPNSSDFISSADLLNISFDYQSFIGFRRTGLEFEESAFMSLLLVKLTAATYYVMFIILIVRKVILWFFIVVSPIFPLLLFFSPIRNTAKIWIGEFFRWLLYGPLFAIFLAGVVALWQQGGVPLSPLNKPCDKPNKESEVVYPTAINILLGGPCQELAFRPEKSAFNSVNIPESFMQYVVALLMLWMVILMPFILLKIFLDYLNSINLSDNNLVKYVLSNRPKPTPPPATPKPTHLPPPLVPTSPKIPPLPMGPTSTGLARQIERDIDISRSLSRLKPELTGNLESQKNIAQILDSTKLKVFSLKDIAKLESGVASRSPSATAEYGKITEALNRIAGTSTLTTPQEQQKMVELKARLIQEVQKGNPLAKGIVEAIKAPQGAQIPEENKVQQVSLEDYEEVRKTWMENYQNLEPPLGPGGNPLDRKEWLREEIKNIPIAVDLLLSGDPQRQAQGKEIVKQILPFLLLGGFSKQEIIAYLKAKLEAAKAILVELVKGDKEEETAVFVERKQQEKPKTMTAEAKLPETAEGMPVGKTPEPGDEKNTNT